MRKTEFNFTQDNNAACKAGETFRYNIFFLDDDDRAIDLTGWTARMQARTGFEAEDTLFDLTTENDGLTISGEYIQILMTAEATAAFPKGKYKYDLEIVSPTGEVGSPLYGKFQVVPEITR